MPSFSTANTARTPFGKNQYLRSTRGLGFESYTLADGTVPEQTIDGFTEKYLQPGQVMAVIASGGDAGKIGPYDPDATDGREETDAIVGLLETFLPWQTKYRDVEVSVCYRGVAVQAWCFETETVTGDQIALTDTTRDLIQALPNIDLTFH